MGMQRSQSGASPPSYVAVSLVAGREPYRRMIYTVGLVL